MLAVLAPDTSPLPKQPWGGGCGMPKCLRGQLWGHRNEGMGSSWTDTARSRVPTPGGIAVAQGLVKVTKSLKKGRLSGGAETEVGFGMGGGELAEGMRSIGHQTRPLRVTKPPQSSAHSRAHKASRQGRRSTQGTITILSRDAHQPRAPSSPSRWWGRRGWGEPCPPRGGFTGC